MVSIKYCFVIRLSLARVRAIVWIPELFLISNWLDPSYRALRPEVVGVTWETFHVISAESRNERQRETLYPLKVRASMS